MSLRSRSDSSTLLRSGPAITRSMDSSRFPMVISVPLCRAVSSAPSLMTFARSAPVKPAVLRAMMSRSTSGANGLPRACTFRMPLRPARSGWATTICRSNRPGRSRAGSRMSGRLGAAMTMTPPLTSNPSSSTSNWFSVCSRSSWPPPKPAPRCLPTASISSTKTIAGAFALACSNRSRTREAPTPTNISTKSGPEVEEKGDPSLPGHSAGEQGLTGARRPVEQHALRDLGADRLEFAGALQEVLDLLEFLDGLIGPRHVREGCLRRVLGDQFRLGLAEVHHPRAAALHLVHHEQEDQDDQDRQGQGLDQRQQPVALGNLDVVALRRKVGLEFRSDLLALISHPGCLVLLA